VLTRHLLVYRFAHGVKSEGQLVCALDALMAAREPETGGS